MTGSSVKAALDVDWSEPKARLEALRTLLEQVGALERWLQSEMAEACAEPLMDEQLATLRQLIAQDTEPDPDGSGPRIREGVAPDRRISLRDADMRHGRKSSSKRFNGYKRHIVSDMAQPGLILAGMVTAANRPEGEVAAPLLQQLEDRGMAIDELHVDRAYADSEGVRSRPHLQVVARAAGLPDRGKFTKASFAMHFSTRTLTCPGGVALPMRPGKTVTFPVEACSECDLSPQCRTSSRSGRTVHIHHDELTQHRRRAEVRTPAGRAALRQRVVVEHDLARIGRSQGRRARYRGLRKNDFDLQRHIVVNNCYLLDNLLRAA